MLHAIIMAGGSGTRFWPASREAKPKQLLDLAGGRTMIEATVRRLGEAISADRILIVTNRRLVAPIAALLPELPAEAIIGEPCKRDTAPCIGLAAALVLRKDPDATMVVMPADHVITPDADFQQAIGQACAMVEADQQLFVTFGITPTYAAESFGYIEKGRPLQADAAPDSTVFAVERFREKPDAETAQRYVDSGNFLWNSGIFVWKAATIMSAIREFEPSMAEHIDRIAESLGTDQFADTLDREFAAIKGKSIDYAVMEKYHRVAVIPAAFEWDDVGNWQSLARTFGSDDNGNTLIGRNLTLASTGSVIRTSDDHLVVAVGVKDCIIVHTENATLVANKHDEEQVRQVVELLKQKGWSEYL